MTEQNADLIMPLVPNNNGSGDNLKKQLIAMVRSLDEAMKSMREGMPNGRDYLDPDLTDKARRQHYDRIAKVDAVREELFEIARYVQRNSRRN